MKSEILLQNLREASATAVKIKQNESLSHNLLR